MSGVLVLMVAVLGGCGCAEGRNPLKEVARWKEVDFAFPRREAREAAIGGGQFVPGHSLPLGLERWHDKLFITVPRWRAGVPSSLNYVSINALKENISPNLIPYPDWDFNNVTDITENDTKIANTFRVRADSCDRLWVMDSGVCGILEKDRQIFSPKLLVFDLKTDKLVREYKLRAEDIKPTSFFANVIVDVSPDRCEEAFAYLPDLGGYSVVVYSWAEDRSWRADHHYFHFDPLSGNFNVGGVNFQWTDGVFGMALSPPGEDGYRTVYFHPLASTREFAVSSEVLRNETHLKAHDAYHKFKVLGSRGPDSQATASFLDEKSGVVFYTQINKDAIGCWNSYKHPTEYSADTNGIVAADNETMVFPNDLKVDSESNLWVLTDRLPSFMYNSLDNNDYNYRVLMAPVAQAIKGTVCE